MSSHITYYKQEIDDLQSRLDQKDERIKQLEVSEERLRDAMKVTWRNDESARISDLFDRLLKTENSELVLKERVWKLEKSEKELQIKVKNVQWAVNALIINSLIK